MQLRIIESVNNPLCKQAANLLQKKYRDKEQAFLLEGETCLREALISGFVPQRVFFVPEAVSSDAHKKISRLVKEKRTQAFAVREGVIRKITDTVSPPSLVAVFAKFSFSFVSLSLKEDSFVLILDELRDPGNVGTIIRTAAAAGIDAVALTEKCADAFSPKVVRSAMGALFHVPVLEGLQTVELLPWLTANSFRIIAAAPGGNSLYQTDFSGRVAVVIGNETQGVGGAFRQAADCLAGIPMKGRAESLNAAVAAALFIYQARGGR